MVGWVPLGPGEPYWPGYTRDQRYIQAINTGIVSDPAGLDRWLTVVAAARLAEAIESERRELLDIVDKGLAAAS